MSKQPGYISTPVGESDGKAIKSKMSIKVLDNISTPKIIWHLVKRHKFGLVLIWAIVMTVSYMFPPVWDIIGSVFL